jgi:hypothetical protein
MILVQVSSGIETEAEKKKPTKVRPSTAGEEEETERGREGGGGLTKDSKISVTGW